MTGKIECGNTVDLAAHPEILGFEPAAASRRENVRRTVATVEVNENGDAIVRLREEVA